MPNCEQLIIDIQETIRENGNNEITGPILQDVLIDMVHALCGEQQSFDELTMWSLLSKATPEQINVSHLSATDVAGMLTQAGYKLTDTTYALATDTVAGLLKTGYAESGKNYAVKLDGTGAAYVTVNWQDKFDTYFGVDGDGNIYVKDNRGFWSNSFVSARGSDPEAGSGGSGGGLDVQEMWYALAQPTTEKINVSHIPAIGMDKVSGLTDALAGKLSGITGEMVKDALGYTPYDASQIGSASVKYAASAGKVAHALSIVAGDVTTVYDGSAEKSVTVPTAEQMALWNKVGGLFDVDADGNVYVKDNRGFYGNSFISARGSDPGAGSGGSSGVDMESVWYALAQPTTEKINVSHIPALQQLSGSLTNAQLANSAITVAGVSVSLGGAVSTEQIASALGLGSNAYTSTAYLPLAGGTMTGHITLGGANSSRLLVQMHDDNSNYRTALGWKSAASGTLIAQIGYWNSAQKITLNPCSDEVSEIWNDAAGKYNFVVGKNWLSYNTYPILHSVNYAGYLDTRYLQKSSYTASDILAKLKTVDGSGSGLDADLLDGYQSTSFQFAVSNNYELSLSGGSRGRYVILLHPDTLSSANNSLPVGYSVQGTFHLFRPLGSGTASIIVKSGAGYSSAWNSGSIIAMPDNNCFLSMKLVTCNYGGKLYRALFVDAVQDINNLYFRGVVMNRDTNFGLAVKFYDYNTGEVTNSEVNGSFADFQYYHAISCPQGIRGNASSATKLATARSIWGQPFDGTQGVDGYLYLGSPDYRLYFGTSGTTSFLTGSNGCFSLHKATNTSDVGNLINVVLSSGYVGIGTTAPTDRLHVIGTIRATTGIWSDGYISAKGQDTTSDARYKRDVAALPAQAALAVLMRLRPSTWAWKDDGRRGAGFVAQEVLGVLPEAVREVGDGEDRHLALNYQMLHAYEVSMLQTHETELERLRGRVNQLENEIKRIRHGS